MTSRGKRVMSGPALEHEIERCREVEHWSKVEELAKKLKSRDEPQFTTLGHFLTGEAKLEQYLHEHPPPSGEKSSDTASSTKSSSSAAAAGLSEAKSCLNLTIGDEAKQLGVHLDSYILLGKLHYALGLYKDALEFYEKANIDSLEEKQLPPRSLKIMAEAFAIKAMCMEKLPRMSSSKSKASEREGQIIRCYELAGDLTLLFLQVADRTEATGQSTWSVASAGTTATAGSSSPIPQDLVDGVKSPKERVGPILESALYQAARMNLKASRNMKAIARWRSMLMAEETESTKEIRRNICCHLAETLLHSCSDGKWTRPDPIDITPSRRPSTRYTGSSVQSHVSESPWRPKRGTQAGFYCPRNKYEELILILILSEYIASKDAVLSQEPKFSPDRKRTYEAATVTYDLMTLTLARFASFRLLCDVLERSMKFSFRQKHTWVQFALALACEGRSFRALLVFKELSDQQDSKENLDVGQYLSMARMCYERLSLYDEGMKLSMKALKSQSAKLSRFYSARCNIYAGLGYSLLVRNIENQSERKDLLGKAEHHYQAGVNMDPDDPLAEYYLALHYSETRRLQKAAEHVRNALTLNPEHLPSLHLMILLLSANNNYEDALGLTIQTLEEFPDNLGLITLRVRLAEVVHGPEKGLMVAKDMLQQWQSAVEKMQADEAASEAAQAPAASTPTFGGVPGSSATMGMSGPTDPVHGYSSIHNNMRMFDTISDKDSISLHAHSMSASHVERTLSEVASSLSSQFPPRSGGPMDPTYSLMRIWLLCAELHLRQNNLEQAELCALEARQLLPMSYHLMYVRGLIFEQRGDYEEARQCYENSLGVNPSHVFSLFHLGKVYYQLGFNRLSEQTLKMAVRIDPYGEQLWSLLGQVTEALARDVLAQSTQSNLVLGSQGAPHVQADEDEEQQEYEYLSNGGGGDSCYDRATNDYFLHDDETLILKEESEISPTQETMAGFNHEAAKLYESAAECHAIALSVQATSPLLPFSSVPLAFE